MNRTQRPEIFVKYGDHPAEMVPALFDAAGVAAMIPPGAAIGIKPNLVVSKPSDSGATTDPGIVVAIIEYLWQNGFHDISIMESAWLGDSTKQAFDICGYRDIEARYGVPLIDLKDTPRRRMRGGGMAIDIFAPVLEVDFLINVPVLKAHSQTKLTCALKNLKGVIPDDEKQRFHSLGLHRPIAALAGIVKADLVAVDGIVGDLSHEEGGNPVRMNRIFVGRDPVLIDAYAATLLGYSPSEIGYIGLAEKLGLGRSTLHRSDIAALNTPKDGPVDTRAHRLAERYADRIDAEDACSPCYGSLIHALHRLERAGKLPRDLRVSIGQGFKDKPLALGIGNCTNAGDCYVKGCPPTAQDIVRFLERL